MRHSVKIFASIGTTVTAGLAALSLASLVACSDSTSAEEKLVPMTIRAYAPGHDSLSGQEGEKSASLKKVAFDGSDFRSVATTFTDSGDEIVVKWDENDKFDVIIGGNRYTFTAKNIDENGEAAVFEGSVPEGTDCSTGCEAVYPSGATVGSVANEQVADSLDRWKNIKNYALMSGTVSTPADGGYTVHFEQKVALVDITLPIDQMDTTYTTRDGSKKITHNDGRIIQVGLNDGDNDFYAKYQVEKFVAKGSTINAIVAVPQTSVPQDGFVKLFVKYKYGSKLIYSKQVKKEVAFVEGKYYALSFTSSDLDEIDDNGTWFKNMGSSCGGIWAKNDFTKDGKHFFTANSSVANADQQNTIQIKNLIEVIDKNADDLKQRVTGNSKWKVPANEDFADLITNCPSYASKGIVFANSNDGYWLSWRKVCSMVGYGAMYRTKNGVWELVPSELKSCSEEVNSKTAKYRLHLRYVLP